jgi:choline dehydrogenase-like flavoprotein
MYDYIIVGAGSAGCVLAHRLTEDPHITVLLLEAGKPDTKPEISIPAAFTTLFKTPYDWAYVTEEEPFLDNRKLYWPRGKVLGGCSSINAMIYIRGNQYDYNSWQEAGNPGWGYADILPYFKKAENQELGPSEYHGVGGLLNVANLRYTNPLSRAFVAACQELDIPENFDFNGETQEGAGIYQVTQKNGARWSAANAYLTPAQQRSNLTVQTEAQAMRIQIEQGRATGVAYKEGEEIKMARAEREVLVCGGAINSPQLLMLSGIGPADHLASHDISVVVDLPGVGQNLQDHLSSGVMYQSTQPIMLPFYSNIAEAGGFLTFQPEAPAPDIQFIFAPTCFTNHSINNTLGHGFTIAPVLLRPQSRGHLFLRSNDPFAHIGIQANYLSEEEDIVPLVQAMRLSIELAHTAAFDAFRGAPMIEDEDLSDEEIVQLICENAETLYHPVGTCKMAPDTDAMAVVDAQLRVYGIEGLRVIDASIMPTIVSGNTNAPTIMIAEKAAEMLKQARSSDTTIEKRAHN